MARETKSMNKYRLFFVGTPGTEMIVAGYDIVGVAQQWQWSGPGPLIRIELVGSSIVQDMTVPEAP